MGLEFSAFSLVYTCAPSSHFTCFHSDDLHSLLSSRFPPHMVPPHHSLHTTGIPHPAIVTPNVKQESSHSDISSLNSSWVDRHSAKHTGSATEPKLRFDSLTFSFFRPLVFCRKQSDAKKEEEKKKQVHIKKPLNAFMLYMKEMRAKVVAECTLKESAAINQILGRRVSLNRSPGTRQHWEGYDRAPQSWRSGQSKEEVRSRVFVNKGHNWHPQLLSWKPSIVDSSLEPAFLQFSCLWWKSFWVLCLVLQWHALSREEQAKYYELARKERQLHMQLYPGWSARDNYVSF